MKIEESSDAIYDQFVKALEIRGLKQTQERFTILREILEIDIPFPIDFLRKQLLSNKYYVSRSTLYNTLKLMEEIGLVDKFFLNGKSYYELHRVHKNLYVIISQDEKKDITLEEDLEKFLISHVEKKYNVALKGMKITFFQN